MRQSPTRLLVCLAWTGTWIGGAWLLPRTAGLHTWALATLVVLAFFNALRLGVQLAAGLFQRAPSLNWIRKTGIACAAVVAALLLFEVVLALEGWLRRPASSSSAATPALTIPEEWKYREAHVPGAARASYWHNILHVYNDDELRRVGEFPAKRSDTFRVMVVGDSFTYGHGVAAEATYCSLLEQELAKRYRIEVLNLGRSGDQSEAVCRRLKKYLPALRPDLVVYGVCLNDFLPADVPQYNNNLAWSISFPGQKHLTDKTRVGAFVAKKYDDLLLALGVRADFYTDILRDFAGYQRRFLRDVKEMNDAVTAAGLPPVTAMVLNQYLNHDKSLQMASVAEKRLAEAGMHVVPSRGYAERYAGKQFTVSPWEGHPNEEAHRIFAAELLPHIEGAAGLARFRRETDSLD